MSARLLRERSFQVGGDAGVVGAKEPSLLNEDDGQVGEGRRSHDGWWW